MDPALMTIKGNFTQRQFDALGKIWYEFQEKNGVSNPLPAIHLMGNDGDIGIISFHKDGNVSAVSLSHGESFSSYPGLLPLIYALIDQLSTMEKGHLRNHLTDLVVCGEQTKPLNSYTDE